MCAAPEVKLLFAVASTAHADCLHLALYPAPLKQACRLDSTQLHWTASSNTLLAGYAMLPFGWSSPAHSDTSAPALQQVLPLARALRPLCARSVQLFFASSFLLSCVTCTKMHSHFALASCCLLTESSIATMLWCNLLPAASFTVCEDCFHGFCLLRTPSSPHA